MSVIRKMTQFVVESVSSDSKAIPGLRFGDLTLGEGVYKTPAFFIHTLAGSVPHITAEVLEHIFPLGGPELRPPLQISIDSTITFSDSVAKFGHGIAKFVGLPESPVFLTQNNPEKQLRGGYNDKNGIALWPRTGKVSLNFKTFEKIISDFKPVSFQGLNDYDVTSESTVKRTKKSTQRALEYLEGASREGQRHGLFVTIESSWFTVDEVDASKTLTRILEKQDQIDGFIISGLIDGSLISKEEIVQKDGGKPQSVLVEKVNYELLTNIVSKLPATKPRYVPGPFGPEQIIELARRGVDLFDSSFITKLTDDGEAFVLEDFVHSEFKLVGSSNESLSTRSSHRSELKEEETKADTKFPGSIISLKEKKFSDDFSPISEECSCYTCRKHTKAYVNHLFATDELLGPVLLMIHNLTTLNNLFRTIRDWQRETNGIAMPSS